MILIRVRQRAPDGDGLLGGAVQNEIHLPYIGAIIQRIRRIKTEAGEIEAAVKSISRIVAHRVLLDDVQISLVNSNM